jgi:hypothetical protein
MKTGFIIYAAGNPPQGWNEEHENGIRDQLPGADAVEVITSETGHFDVSDAWYALVTKGISLIVCKLAVFNEFGQMKLTKRELRLCG